MADFVLNMIVFRTNHLPLVRVAGVVVRHEPVRRPQPFRSAVDADSTREPGGDTDAECAAAHT